MLRAGRTQKLTVSRVSEYGLYLTDEEQNEVLLPNRYISLTRRRLTIGSHSGAEAAALYHSLAITCHRCGVNVFDYFCDIIDRCAAWPPNTPIEKYRDLLPDRRKPSQK